MCWFCKEKVDKENTKKIENLLLKVTELERQYAKQIDINNSLDNRVTYLYDKKYEIFEILQELCPHEVVFNTKIIYPSDKRYQCEKCKRYFPEKPTGSKERVEVLR